MCDCENVDFGTYANQIEVKAPDWSSKETICLDRCIAQEVLDLWSRGVKTGGCCCGHNKVQPFINPLTEQDAIKMAQIGYFVMMSVFGSFVACSLYLDADRQAFADLIVKESMKVLKSDAYNEMNYKG